MGGTAFLPETVKMYDQGWEKGMIRGRREGKREGKREGIALGERRGILATAWRMKLGGLDAAQIAAFTGLSLAEVEELRGDEAEDPA